MKACWHFGHETGFPFTRPYGSTKDCASPAFFLQTHTLVHTQLVHTHTTCPHTTCSHTTYSHTQLVHTQLVHTQLVITKLAHTQLVHTHLVHTQLVHTQLVLTQLAHTHTQLTHTQLVHTQLVHTQLVRTQLAHTQLTHTQQPHNLSTHTHTLSSHNFLTHNFFTYVYTCNLSTHRCLHSRRGTWRHRASLCVAGGALGDTSTLCGWRGTYGTGLDLVARLGWIWRCGRRLGIHTTLWDVLHRSWTMLMLDKKTIAACPFAATLIAEPQAF